MTTLVYIEQKKNVRIFIEYVTDRNKYDQKINIKVYTIVNIEEILKFLNNVMMLKREEKYICL